MELGHFHYFYEILRHGLGFLALKNLYELQNMCSWCPRLANEVFYTNMK